MPPSWLSEPEALNGFSRPALVIGHPGHELKVFGWMSEYKPRVYVLTDGSGRRGRSRVPSTADLIGISGAEPGEIFGPLSDVEMYRAIVQKNIALFFGIVDELTSSFLRHAIDFVAGDATEGFNPTHDLCRMLVNAAVAIVQRATGKAIANYEFCLAEGQDNFQEIHDSRCLHFGLDNGQLAEKLNAAEEYVELRDEVRQAVALHGREYFRVECLRNICPRRVAEPALSGHAGKPFYESWGEEQVAKGKYESVIRFEEHMLPISEAIDNYASCASLDALLSRCES